MRSRLSHLLIVFGLSILLASFTILRVPGSPGMLLYADTSFPSYTNAKDHRGKTIISTNELTRFSSGSDNDCYPVDKISRHFYFYLETANNIVNGDSLR